jgi:hypothetical protein
LHSADPSLPTTLRLRAKYELKLPHAVYGRQGSTLGANHRIPYTDLVAWPFADYVFGADWDVMSDVTKSRLYGFHDVVDSEAMFVRLLRRFREERIVP